MNESPLQPASTALLRTITEAADGLLYSSESDRPLEPFCLPAGQVGEWPPAPVDFGRAVGAGPDEEIREQSVEAFFRRHIEYVEPADEAAWRLLPRYDGLKRLLENELADLRVFRVGRVLIRCYIAGRGPGGDVLGLQTVAVET